MTSFENLRAVRERLGYRFEGVLRLSALSADRLQAIEAGAAPTVFETEELGRLYGIDADVLGDVPIRVPDDVHALASSDEFMVMGDVVRARVVAAALACRDLRWLLLLLDRPDPAAAFRSERPSLLPKTARLAAEQGGRLAAELRKAWRLDSRPIASLRDLLAERLPSVEILYADLTPAGPAGLSFLDAKRGPAIVVNAVGKNENPLVRRFSLAHELCHLLVDWSTKAPLAQISGYLTDSGLEREQRANGFAVRLLCPEAVLARLKRSNLEDAPALARELGKYGLHYAAVRLYLHNVARMSLPPNPPAEAVLDASAWAPREAPQGLDGFPLAEVPLERRTAVARLAAPAYARGLVSRARFAELLGTTRAQPVERVLDFYGLDPPADRAA
jgi:Zn-dependent peptidase ImmA (M78 family)